MVQMVTVNELMPKTGAIVNAEHQPLSPETMAHIDTVLTFLEQELGDRTYFGGDTLNLADIVVGATVPLLSRMGLDLSAYRSLKAWCQTITTRQAWIETSPSDTALTLWQQWVQRQIRAKFVLQERKRRQAS
ncbi:MAG: hypothetical protein F6K09_27490 [Merismopedia sp. SIO2A8]|nr:hypothetical protein [Merismopedia sp. SIO2A8]